MNPFSILAALLRALSHAVTNRHAPSTRGATGPPAVARATADTRPEPLLLVRQDRSGEYWEVAAPPRRLFSRSGRELPPVSLAVCASPNKGLVLEVARLLLGRAGGGAIWVLGETDRNPRAIYVSSGGGVTGALCGGAAEASVA